METYPLLTDTNPPCHADYLRIDNRLFNDLSKKGDIKYPKSIDPYNIRREIVFLFFICVSICILFGVSFLEDLVTFLTWDLQYCEMALCVLVLLSCVLLLVYFVQGRSWTNFLFHSGFFVFPQSLQGHRTVVVFLWSAGIFCFSPALLAVRHFCHHNTSNSGNNVTRDVKNNSSVRQCDTVCIHPFTSYQLLQLYLALASLVQLVAMVHYLVTVCIFRSRRRWPDIWHERLLEESALIEYCPLMKTSELRIDNHHPINNNNPMVDDVHSRSSLSVTTSHSQGQSASTSARVPSDREIMQTQAYVIKYLRNLNNQLAQKLYLLANEQRQLDPNCYPSTVLSDSRENHFEPSILSSVDCRTKHNADKGNC